MSNLSAFLDTISHSEGTDRAADPYRVSESSELVRNPFGDKVRSMRRFWCWKGAKVQSLSLRSYSCAEADATVSRDAEKSGFIVRPSAFEVFLISVGRNVAKVCKSVISSTAVYMVYLIFWPFPGHVKPRKSMSKITGPVDANFYVSTIVLIASYVARLYAISPRRWSFEPREKTGLIIVAEQFSQSFGGNHGV